MSPVLEQGEETEETEEENEKEKVTTKATTPIGVTLEESSHPCDGQLKYSALLTLYESALQRFVQYFYFSLQGGY